MYPILVLSLFLLRAVLTTSLIPKSSDALAKRQTCQMPTQIVWNSKWYGVFLASRHNVMDLYAGEKSLALEDSDCNILGFRKAGCNMEKASSVSGNYEIKNAQIGPCVDGKTYIITIIGTLLSQPTSRRPRRTIPRVR
ncbi:hypothetical protein BJ170DRAFT_680814 [Xylariales sp. AK1849]|nr:hypothetical protein BJ170DRAFT_680814 [Xylariales sp. AK1849]